MDFPGDGTWSEDDDVGDGCIGLIWGGFVVMRSDKHGSVNPGLLKAGGVVLAVLIVGATGVVLYHDRHLARLHRRRSLHRRAAPRCAAEEQKIGKLVSCKS